MSYTASVSPWPIFRDGLSSTLSYVFLAVKDAPEYNCIVWSPERKKLKFYPSADFWLASGGTTLETLGLPQKLYNREDYDGLYAIDREDVCRVLEYVGSQRGVTVVNTKVFMEQDFNTCDRHQSRQYHPAGSRIPPGHEPDHDE